MPTWAQRQAICDRQIRDKGQQAVLRRSTGDRECWIHVENYAPNELTTLRLATDSRGLITPVGLSEAPDERLDTIVLASGDEYKQVSEPEVLAPAGVVMYYEVHMRWLRRV